MAVRFHGNRYLDGIERTQARFIAELDEEVFGDRVTETVDCDDFNGDVVQEPCSQ